MLNKILHTGATLRGSKILGIIISPTQELALQTDAVVKQFSTHISHVKTCVFVGGMKLTCTTLTIYRSLREFEASCSNLESNKTSFTRQFTAHLCYYIDIGYHLTSYLQLSEIEHGMTPLTRPFHSQIFKCVHCTSAKSEG